ncbi:hypothetical protein [[Mycoplasma] gypis]|uniref:Uncharacterized protein n=1 Tax=[Mycoplasma] gypis TaxID=92404 RepID=A0ABZ2RN66_9BACT|nr:hypothetical protein [[Mycoplasma] gypis]MBN0919616.1 hypothetical protein [[Mycoplasma] gypis]
MNQLEVFVIYTDLDISNKYAFNVLKIINKSHSINKLLFEKLAKRKASLSEAKYNDLFIFISELK